MKRWLVVGAMVLAVASAITLVVLARDDEATSTARTNDALVEEFRRVERACLTTYNTALAEQRANRIDELDLATTIERDVIAPWQSLRARIAAATVPPGGDELYGTLRAYLEARQVSWQAYVSGLRAASDDAARPHLEVHRQKNAEAQDHAKQLGRMFRERGM